MSNPDNGSDTNQDAIDNYENITYETRNESYRKPSSVPQIMAAVGFLIIVILLIVVISRGQDLAEKKQIIAIEERIDLLAERLDRVIKELDRDDQTTALPKTPRTKTPPPPKKEPKGVKPESHKVQAGDTLYKISRHYGISIEQLRAYNKLEPNAKIYPGQELKLTP